MSHSRSYVLLRRHTSDGPWRPLNDLVALVKPADPQHPQGSVRILSDGGGDVSLESLIESVPCFKFYAKQDLGLLSGLLTLKKFRTIYMILIGEVLNAMALFEPIAGLPPITTPQADGRVNYTLRGKEKWTTQQGHASAWYRFYFFQTERIVHGRLIQAYRNYTHLINQRWEQVVETEFKAKYGTWFELLPEPY